MSPRADKPVAKQAIRERVWQAMQVHGAARFPGTRGRIPNFVGAERAALRLGGLPEWRRARVIKIKPDAPQLPVRRLALREGKLVYMAVPRLRALACFIELDPARLGARCARAATIAGSAEHGRPVELDKMRPVDLIVCGAVGVNGRGMRVGKGGGYSDLEFGLLVEHALVSMLTPVVTTVHPLQIVPAAIEQRPHDLVLDRIVTPDRVLSCGGALPRPRGIYWEYLAEEQIEAVPALAALRCRPSAGSRG
jgi:5-formyltetrahydrofolate cyclo-ligase